MAVRYISGLSEEAMVLLGVEPGNYVNEAVQARLEADVRQRGFTSILDFVMAMRAMVRVGNGEKSKAEVVG
jgi:hypothetical protein